MWLKPLPFRLSPPANQPRVVSGLEVEQAVRDARLRGPSALAMLAAEIAPCVIKNPTVAQLYRLVGDPGYTLRLR
jgi:hypothetical protein